MREAVATGILLAWIAGGCRSPESESDAIPSGASGLQFTEVTAEAGLAEYSHVNGAFGQRLFPEIMSGAVAFVDANDDGWQDLIVAGGGQWRGENHVPAVRLFENQKNGQFLEVTQARGLGGLRGYVMGIAAADIDNDDDVDVFVTTVYRDLLLRNEGPEAAWQFTEVGEAVGVAGDSTWSTAAVLLDADRDGLLDLFVGRYVPWSPATDRWCMTAERKKSYCTPEVYDALGPVFFQNVGHGQYVDRTGDAGFAQVPGKALGATEFDYDADGWPDLFVANDTEPDLLFRNEGNGSFREIGAQSGIAYDDRGKARAGMGVDVGVVDTTMRPTYFVGNFSNEMIGVYRYLGRGSFQDRAAVSRVGGVSRRSLSFGLFLFDVDLDGDLDLFVANGHIAPEVDEVDDDVQFRQPPLLFLNDGTGNFADAVPGVGGTLADPMLGRGAAYADFDRDGDLDIAVVENGGALRLFRNDTRINGVGPAFLRVVLEGSSSNRSAIGSTIIAWVGASPQLRRVRTGGSYLSQSELPVTFGFGAAQTVDSIEVRWPSGSRTVLRDLSVNQELQIREND